MFYVESIVLAVVQGITEFLPVSSSGHLLLVHTAFGQVESTLGFDVALHWGTVLAMIVVFRHDLKKLIKDWWTSIHSWNGSVEQRLPWYLLLAGIPAGVVGVLFGNQIEAIFRSTDWVILLLVAVAFLFFAVEKASTQSRHMTQMNWKDALMIGVAQVLALVPGTSRSGITMVAGMARNLTREQAARFSFLSAIPLIFAAGVKELLDVIQAGRVDGPEGLSMLLGVVVAALVGYVALQFLLHFVVKYSLRVFAWYRIILAILVLLLIRFT